MWKVLTTTLFAASLAAVSGCSPTVTNPCDILVDIPEAPADVNRILVSRARPTAEGIAKNQKRVVRYGCEEN